MNVSLKFPLIHHITKGLTPCSSFPRKASISFTFNRIALQVRLSSLLSTSAFVRPASAGSWPSCALAPAAPWSTVGSHATAWYLAPQGEQVAMRAFVS